MGLYNKLADMKLTFKGTTGINKAISIQSGVCLNLGHLQKRISTPFITRNKQNWVYYRGTEADFIMYQNVHR